MNTVCVLLSTYNGEQYLHTQIDSILSQKNVDLILYIRDDGSTDSTKEIISDYAKQYPNIKTVLGNQIGIGRSFMSLLYSAEDADYYAFSDQDDYWYPDKMEAAVTMLESEPLSPTLYCCNQNCVNSEGEYLAERFPDEYKVPPLISNIFSNYFAGCTMVMNSALRNYLVQEKYRPGFDYFRCRIHDAWVACVALAVGKILFDPKPYMDFRRHVGTFSDEYVAGQKSKSMTIRYIGKVRRLIRRLQHHDVYKKQGIKKTAFYIETLYEEFVDSSTSCELELISNYDKSIRNGIRLLKSGIVHKYVKNDRMIMYCKILFGGL